MAKRKPEPGDLDFDWATMDPNNVDRLLGEAKGSLGRADALSAETDSTRLATLPASLAALRRPDDVRGSVRKVTEPLAEVGNKAMLAAIPAGINPAIGGALLTGGGLATLPDYLRRLIAPEGDEENVGLMDTGAAALSALPATGALRSLKTFGRAAEEASPLADLVGGRALAYEGAQAGARPAGRAAAQPIDRLMATDAFSKLPKGPVSKVPGRPQGAATFADAVRAESSRAKSPFERLSAEGAFGGDRTNRGVGALETEGPQGLSAVKEGRVAPNEMPWEPVELPSPLSRMDRLTARSMEHFGKKYRKE